MRFVSILLGFAISATFCQALSTSGTRLLVVTDQAVKQDDFSKFWANLESRGYSLTFEDPKSESLALFQHGARLYDHVVILPTKAKGLGSTLAPKQLIRFLDEQGNIFVALGAGYAIATGLSSFLTELGIYLPTDKNSVVVDHFAHGSAAKQSHDDLWIKQSPSMHPVGRSLFGDSGMIYFPRSVGQKLNGKNQMHLSILDAPETSYMSDLSADSVVLDEALVSGAQISLVSAIQMRNSARITIFGSLEALKDSSIDHRLSRNKQDGFSNSNEDFASAVSAWTFQEIGVLKTDNVVHGLRADHEDVKRNATSIQNNHHPAKLYRIQNEVVFSLDLCEYNGDRLVSPVLAPDDNLQLEFTMLSPYSRTNLSVWQKAENCTTFGTSLRLPDQHGIFRFHIDYRRPFLTNIDVREEVSVRHFAHDEWPRSFTISAAWVWITGIWSTIVGWLVFVGVWLWSTPKRL